jgi:hypothetical protein
VGSSARARGASASRTADGRIAAAPSPGRPWRWHAPTRLALGASRTRGARLANRGGDGGQPADWRQRHRRALPVTPGTLRPASLASAAKACSRTQGVRPPRGPRRRRRLARPWLPQLAAGLSSPSYRCHAVTGFAIGVLAHPRRPCLGPRRRRRTTSSSQSDRQVTPVTRSPASLAAIGVLAHRRRPSGGGGG